MAGPRYTYEIALVAAKIGGQWSSVEPTGGGPALPDPTRSLPWGCATAVVAGVPAARALGPTGCAAEDEGATGVALPAPGSPCAIVASWSSSSLRTSRTDLSCA